MAKTRKKTAGKPRAKAAAKTTPVAEAPENAEGTAEATPRFRDPSKVFVFASPHPGFNQVLKNGWKKFYPNGEVEAFSPLLADFSELEGFWITEDVEEAEMMRKKIAKKRATAIPAIKELIGEEKLAVLDSSRRAKPIRREGATFAAPVTADFQDMGHTPSWAHGTVGGGHS